MGNKGIWAAAAALALLACSPKNDQKAEQTPTNVTLTAEQRGHIQLFTVASSRFRKTIDTTGVVDFDNDQATQILAPISGPVTRVLVQPGDAVKKGAALAAVASPDFAAAVSAYRKALAAAQNARRIADNDKQLAAHQSISEREAQQAESDAIGAEADRDAALKAVTALNVDPDTVKAVADGHPIEGMIRSPLAGTVVERSITPGQLLAAGTTPAFTVADLSRVWVMAQVFESDLGTVGVGDAATVSAGGRNYAGQVTNITPEIDPDTRSMKVRVALNNPGGVLKRQMYVHVLIQARQDNQGILIPVSAVLRDDENLPFVYVVQPDGSFARRHVTLGNRSGDRFNIMDGLRVGDRLVADGALFLQFMQQQ
jgi:cobalt-zinc-cadmium efflux system membrane fusion protein